MLHPHISSLCREAEIMYMAHSVKFAVIGYSMKPIQVITFVLSSIIALGLQSCSNGRSELEQQEYTDSLLHVISCSPTIVDSHYTLEDQLDACDLLIKEYPNKKSDFEEIKATIKKQIEERDNEIK